MLAVAVAIVLIATPTVFAQVALDDEFGREPSWKAPASTDVRTQVLAWLDERKPEDALRRQAVALWPVEESANIRSTQLLERVVATLALVDAPSKQLVDLCSKPHGVAKTPEYTWLTDPKSPPLVRHNLRLWLGKWLAQERLYDEAYAQLNNLQPEDVADPASLLFYQGVCHHWMLHKDEGLKSIARLLEQRKAIPRRYEQVAELMHTDLAALEDESLDHISRRMNDVTRRLDFGQAGQRIRGIEDGIIASLDKLIKQLEDMANAAGGGGGNAGQREGNPGGPGDPQGIRSRGPAADSRLARGKGAGEVKSKNLGNRSGWGDLPPKERDEAMQQISKEFPSHYRDIIEQYFRKLASEDDEK